MLAHAILDTSYQTAEDSSSKDLFRQRYIQSLVTLRI